MSSPIVIKRSDVEHGSLPAAIFEAVPDALAVVDESGRFVRVNRRIETMFGYTSDELIGQPVEMLLPDRHRERHGIHREQYVAHPTTRPMGTGREFVGRRKDSSEFPVEVALNPLPTDSGLLIVATIVDRTAFQQRERERNLLLDELVEERRWLRALIERSPIGIIFVEGSVGDRIVANRRAEVLFGHPLPSESGLAQLVEHVCNPDGSACPFEQFPATRALRGDVVSGAELLLRRLDGRELPVLVNTGPIRDASGQVTGAIAVLDDLTPIKELERLRQEWTSIIAHDLRQPVTVIIGYVGQLAKQPEANVDEIRKPLEHIRASALRLSRMINDLLNVSRIEKMGAAGIEMNWEITDLRKAAEAVVNTQKGRTDKHTLVIDFEPEHIEVETDPDKIQNILQNFVSNAIKYSEGGEVRIIARQEPPSEEFPQGSVLIGVKDQGIGLSEKEIKRIGEKFFRSENKKARAVGGTGIGLFLVKNLIARHGGYMWVESELGKGSTFWFRIPLRQPKQSEVAKAS